ncbi:microtubule-associated protein futsch isoform X3 [Periplaneta americana]|uniref:microtubule-associated protein futsch isoform X3 n=1 Tax=Periplaneta americana TaxID=6978 RepID=UPI0037E79D2A
MGRRNKVASDLHLQRNKRGTPLYSKEDIREQYCITSKQLDVLERARGSGLFGCLSNYHKFFVQLETFCCFIQESSCRSRNSLLSVCVRRKVPSDENLHELCRRPAAAYAPLPRWPRYPPPAPPPPEFCHYDDDLECSYFRRRPRAFCNAADPKRYTWMSEDEESTRMERPRPILDGDYDGMLHYPRRPGSCLARYPGHSHYLSYSSEYLASPCPAHPDLPPPPPPPAMPLHHDVPPPHRTKHVSFARSHTLTSFDDAMGNKPVVVARSQERLIDGKKSLGELQQQQAGGAVGESPKVVIMEKVKRAPMKTQATQTEVCLGRKPLAPNYLSLSPRTIHRVRMVSQGAQTNGNNMTRRLMKSYSEAGERFGAAMSGVGTGYPYHYPMDGYDDMRRGSEHEPLHRTQSEEPPRSPFLVTTPPESLSNISQPQATPATGPPSAAETLQAPQQQPEPAAKKKSKTYKEIFIDFEPQGVERRGKKRMLQKTMSEGEILVDRHRGSHYNALDMDLLADNGLEGPEGDAEVQADSDYGQYYPHHMEDRDDYLEPLEKRSASRFSSTPADLAAGGTSPPLAEDQQAVRSQEDEFHENLIYRGLFRKRSVSLEDTAVSSTTSDPDMAVFQQQRAAVAVNTGHDDDEDVDEISEARSAPPVVEHDRGEDVSDEDEGVGEDVDTLEKEKKSGDEVSPSVALEKTDKDGELLPPTRPLTQPSSLFASSDSLANDMRDHSDGIWNESQATVLQVADTDITALSASELSSLSAAGAGNLLALTPSSRRKQLLLLQHQQRSSMDTEALDEEMEEFDAQVPQAPPSPRIRIEGVRASLKPSPSSTVPTPNQEVPQLKEDIIGIRRRLSSSPDRLEQVGPAPCPRERVLSPSPRREFKRKKSPVPSLRTPESSHDSTQQHSSLESTESTTRGPGPTVPDLLMLARTDSGGKTGTDLSETSTCTTEDYATANDYNSGTDTSSRRSLIHAVGGLAAQGSGSTGGSFGAGEGSSFESASSHYSLAREVSCSPPPIPEESDLPTTPQLESEDNQTSTTPRVSVDMTATESQPQQQLRVTPEHKEGITSPSGESSSSSGSYSVDGSGDEAETKEPTSPPHSSVQKPSKATTPTTAQVSTPTPTPTPAVAAPAESGSEDEERSAHYSSSGYYESPPDEEEGYVSAGSRVGPGERREWTEEEKRRRKKGFKLDFSPMMEREGAESPSPAGGTPHQKETESWSRRSSGKSDRSSKEDLKRRSEKKTTPPGTESKDKERTTTGRRGKSRSRSPVQHHRRTPSSAVAALPGAVQPSAKKGHKADKEVITPGMVRSPAMHEGFRAEDWGTLQRTTTPAHTPEDGTLLGNGTTTAAGAGSGGGGTSDDSSCGGGGRRASEAGSITPTQQQQSPRRHRRVRESPRRKGAPGGGRSPTATQQRLRRRSGSGEEKGLSPAVTLARRRSSIPAKSPLTQQAPTSGLDCEDASRSSRLSPHRYSRSPGGSPSRSKHRSRGSPKLLASSDTPTSKAQGAMSPESSRLKALSAESLRSVSPGSDSVFYSEGADHSSNTTTLCHHCGREVDKSATLSGLEDGEAGPGETIEPEPPDIVQPPAGFADSPEGPRNKPASSGRLYKKLEKRFRSEERGGHGERRHHSRYRCDGARAKSEERGREDRVKLSRPLARSTDASMEMLRAADSSPNVMVHDTSMPDLATSEGEEEDTGVYAESYRNATWIYIGDSEEMHVWLKPETRGEDKEEKSGEGEEETPPGSARRDSAESTGSEKDFRRKYQAITHRMVHRKSSVEMYKRLASKSFECDKTVVVRRESGEFGFRIHGSRPVVVSAIEPDTPAETSGLEVGDIIISINNVNVLDASHSEVVKIAHAGSDTLELEVARTCNVLTPVVREPGAGSPLYSGYLWKLGGMSNGAKWVQRWFCLKRDNCLYYYKNDTESQPLGALMLVNYNVSRTPDSGRLYSFLLDKTGAAGLHLAADDEESAMRWLAVISHSIERNAQVDQWLDISNRNLKLAASAVQQPDCFGYLMKLGHKWKAWKRRYCVLKDACLYFYQDGNSDGALGMTCLHGYRVQNSTAGGKRFAFEILPPEPRQRHYYFHTDTEMDKKRWLAALEYSIDRWIKVG